MNKVVFLLSGVWRDLRINIEIRFVSLEFVSLNNRVFP